MAAKLIRAIVLYPGEDGPKRTLVGPKRTLVGAPPTCSAKCMACSVTQPGTTPPPGPWPPKTSRAIVSGMSTDSDDILMPESDSEEPKPHPNWNIQNEGRSWGPDEAWERFDRTIELKIEMYKGKLFWSDETRSLILGRRSRKAVAAQVCMPSEEETFRPFRRRNCFRKSLETSLRCPCAKWDVWASPSRPWLIRAGSLRMTTRARGSRHSAEGEAPVYAILCRDLRVSAAPEDFLPRLEIRHGIPASLPRWRNLLPRLGSIHRELKFFTATQDSLPQLKTIHRKWRFFAASEKSSPRLGILRRK